MKIGVVHANTIKKNILVKSTSKQLNKTSPNKKVINVLNWKFKLKTVAYEYLIFELDLESNVSG